MIETSPKSVGLGGDGDEIHAIKDVEEAFGVSLDYTDANHWHTAGDVYQSLCKALSTEEASKPETWGRFATALAFETGVDPDTLSPDSPLLSQSWSWAKVADASAVVWLVVAISGIVVIGLAML